MRRKPVYTIAIIMAVITFAVYLPALQNDFVNWDDNEYVYENPFIRSLDATLLNRAFLGFHSANWHPLTWLSHALDYALWGLNPRGHHFTSILLHALNTFLVVLVIARLMGIDRTATPAEGALSGRSVLITAGAAGLLFGLHPLHVESAAWVAERKDLLCALFFLLSISAYTNYVRSLPNEQFSRTPLLPAGNRQYLVALAFFILALLSKPMAITLPAVLLVLDWHPFSRINSWNTLRTAVIDKTPFILLSLASAVLTVLAQQSVDAVRSIQFAPMSTRILVATRSLGAYVWKMLWPADLAPLYPYDPAVTFLSPGYLAFLSLVIAIAAICVITVKKHRTWSAAWSCYLITLLPVLGIIQIGDQAMADRYTYLPGIAPFFLAGLGAAWLSKRLLTKTAQLAGVVLAIAACACLAYVTVVQIGTWKDSIHLWNAVITKEPKRIIGAYLNRAQAFERLGHTDSAIADYESAIALNPSHATAFFNLGTIYGKTGQFDKATAFLNRAIDLKPDLAEAYANRGAVHGMTDRIDEALNDFARSLSLRPDNATAHMNRGKVYAAAGTPERALSDFRRACALGMQEACDTVRRLGGSPR